MDDHEEWGGEHEEKRSEGVCGCEVLQPRFTILSCEAMSMFLVYASLTSKRLVVSAWHRMYTRHCGLGRGWTACGPVQALSRASVHSPCNDGGA